MSYSRPKIILVVPRMFGLIKKSRQKLSQRSKPALAFLDWLNLSFGLIQLVFYCSPPSQSLSNDEQEPSRIVKMAIRLQRHSSYAAILAFLIHLPSVPLSAISSNNMLTP
jgi:hypothetical protein